MKPVFPDERKLGLLLYRSYVRTRRASDRALRPFNINLRHAWVLSLASEHKQSQLQLCERTDLNANVMVRTLDHLEKLELIRREQNPKDARENLVVLTEAGRKVITEAVPQIVEAQSKFVERLSAEGHETLLRLLNRSISD